MAALLVGVALALAAAPPVERVFVGPESVASPAGEVAPAPKDRSPIAASAEELPDEAPPEEEEIAPARARPSAEAEAAEAEGEDDDAGGMRRLIVVTTDLLGTASRFDLFRHAGGRSTITSEAAKDRGSSSVGEVLDRAAGVRSVEGNAGIGSTSTKLNVGVRGANPRLSSEATVMLDEVPIAPAPYGQPQLSLFPLSIFSIDNYDVVRGGSSVRFGPRTSGGVFNLISKPIPQNPRIAVFAQSDQFGDAGAAASYGGTHRGLGMYFEYAPRFGRNYRQHSEFQAHGGLVKLAYSPRRSLDVQSTTHLFYEASNLPGGLDEKQYTEGDRFRSVRPYDRFIGDRIGTALRARWRPREDHELQTIVFFNHTTRMSVMERLRSLENEPPTLYFRPRRYDVGGIEPRYALRIRHKNESFQDVSFGGRVMLERGRSRECRELSPPDQPGVYSGALAASCEGLTLDQDQPDPQIRRDSDARIAAYALYVDDKLNLLDSRLVITGGARLEVASLAGRNNLSQRALSRTYWQVLPAGSLWFGPIDEVAIFAGYGRSFGPSQFLQVDTATSDMNFQLNPEIADMVEGGVKLMELAGVEADVTGWYRHYQDLSDVGETMIDRIAGAHVWGIETEVSWEPGEIWEAAEGLGVSAGYSWTESRISAGQYKGNRLAWYPSHEVWGSAEYAWPFGLKLGADVSHNSPQFTDYANKPAGFDASGATGQIPAYTLMGAFARLRAPLPDAWQIEVTFGVKNLLNESWFMRTDDENRGILAMRPRTFYLSLGFAHDFLPRGARAQAEARRAKQRGTAGAIGARRIDAWARMRTPWRVGQWL
jgi:Fe(3+) dicitrate transport protein